MNITVLIPTYRRSKDLANCLESLKRQTRLPDEVWVVVRDIDTETYEFLEAFPSQPLPLFIATVKMPGQVSALNIGIKSSQGDILAITDDDTVPYSDWLERIESHFISDDQVGGVGGRDWVYHGSHLEDGNCEIVGRLQWTGRVVGNHHIGSGGAREVDVLKGANMSYRKTAIVGLYFNEHLKGTGAQVHNDLAFSLAVKRKGWKLIYDPSVAVNHFPAPRFDEDQRNQFNAVATIYASHNETLALLDYLHPIRQIIFLTWALMIGTSNKPGFLQLLRLLPSNGFLALSLWWLSLRGRWQGWRTWQRTSKKFNGFGS